MQVTIILEFPASYCYLARGIAQVYLLYFKAEQQKGYLAMHDLHIFNCVIIQDKAFSQ